MKRILLSLLFLAAPALHARDTSALAAQVRATETAFAASMANRDLKAFSALIADDAIFFGRNPLRGKAAVLEVWANGLAAESEQLVAHFQRLCAEALAG